MPAEFDFLSAVQSRTARIAVGPSTVRGLGVSGVVESARSFLRAVQLRPFGTPNHAEFMANLDETTVALQRNLPRGARHWGVARKVLNIFLRDCLYTIYLRDAHSLALAEKYFEVPLDSLTGNQLWVKSEGLLPKWAGVRYLKHAHSELYQREASRIATLLGTDRVHLDAYWWSVSRDGPPV